jgi:hypothetical protein
MTPPARRPGDEIQSAGYARRSHPHAIADVGSIPTVSIRTVSWLGEAKKSSSGPPLEPCAASSQT